jgi:transposase InsO family protein
MSSWLDLWSHVIVGWSVEEHMREGLVIDSFTHAELKRKPTDGIIIHSDGGGQYSSVKFRKIIDRGNYLQSMTRKNNHYDNATAESLFSRLKAELIEEGIFLSVEDARTECFDYIEGYYNTQRKHSSIDYKKPLQFEREMGY